MGKLTTAGLLLATAALAGCFKSQAPLISVFEGQAPIPSGIYTYTEDNATKQVAVSVDWPATVVTESKPDGSLEVDRYYMRAVKDGFYVAMDKSNNYGLVRVASDQVVLYEASDNCYLLQGLGEVPEETEATYDVDISGDDESSTCTFKDFGNLAQAYSDLIDDGSLKVARTYVRRQ